MNLNEAPRQTQANKNDTFKIYILTYYFYHKIQFYSQRASVNIKSAFTYLTIPLYFESRILYRPNDEIITKKT